MAPDHCFFIQTLSNEAFALVLLEKLLFLFPLYHLFEIQVVDRGVFVLLHKLHGGHALLVQGAQVLLPFTLLDTRIVIVTLLGKLLH